MNKLLPARKQVAFIPEQRNNTTYRPARQNYEQHKPRQKPRFNGEAAFFCALIVLLVMIGIGFIGMYGRLIAINYQVQQVNREISRLQEEREYLNIEVKKLASLERIEYIAVNELGLQYPERRQWLVLSSRGGMDNN